MIYYKRWHERGPLITAGQYHEWEREGWFLFGFIPLYVRDRQSRGLFGTVPPT